jgi:hypothetical protein
LSFEIECREPEMRDNFTDGVDPKITVEPGAFFSINEKEAFANYGKNPIKITIQIVGSKTLIGYHDE